MHIYYFKAVIKFYNIKGNNNTNKKSIKNQSKINVIMIFVIKYSSELY
jgi:hypothetical protein